MVAGPRTLYAIAKWSRLQSPDMVRAFGLSRATPPAVSTRRLVFRDLGAAAFEAARTTRAQTDGGTLTGPIAIDGKRVRGIRGARLPGVRLVDAYSDEAGRVLAQAGGRTRRGWRCWSGPPGGAGR